MKDQVFEILSMMLSGSPEASYKRLNPALRDTLANCISADIPFQPDTFRNIYDNLRGHWWFGDGAGSSKGENFYTLACDVNHAAACISFEQFASRPAVLWEENTEYAERLHVGSQFSWAGHRVTVTSMRTDSMVACSYKGYPASIKGLKVGAEICYDDPHLITYKNAKRRDGTGLILHVVKAPKNHGDREVSKRFTIPYAEISEFRRTSKANLRKLLVEIAECDPEKDAKRLTKAVNAGHFPHWQLEEIRSAFGKRKAWKADEGRIEAWRLGVNGAYLEIEENILRVRGDRVECSNGNAVSRAVVERVLPVVLARRKDFGALALPLDGYKIEALKPEGVKIRCTLIAWPEVDRLVETLAT